MMRKVKISPLILVLIISALSLFIITSQKVFAEASVCYIRHGSDPNVTTTRPDCGGEPNFREIYKNYYGSDKVLEDNKCYIIHEGQHGITPGDAFGSEICNAAESVRSDKGSAAPAPGGGGGSTPAPGGGTTTPTGGNQAGGTPEQPKTEAPKKIDRKKDVLENTDCGNIQKDASKCGIIKTANNVIKFLSALLGVVVTIMMIAGGIRYSSAGGDPQAVASAKNMIKNAVIALIAFLFLLAFLNWVVPGGLI